MSLAAGARLGPYEVTAQIGVGGMGEVYRATDTNLKRAVAIKVLPDTFANDPERLARFEREAKTLASLNHPNIAQIHGLERADGVQALVMELVEGPTLADRIVQGPIAVDEALPIARQIAEALEAAHEQGIIHRDLKPANIKLRPDGVVKVLDFGLAKALEPPGAVLDASQSPTITSPAMTRMGVILGTAAYMSPEQARGSSVDRRTDIWAFGCVLYEMLTGRTAFAGETISDTIAAILGHGPDWQTLPETTPASVRRLLHRCLEKDPKRRLHDFADARIELDDVLTPPPAQTTPIASSMILRPASPWRRIAAFAVVALVAGSLAVAVLRPPATQAPRRARFTIPAPEGTVFGSYTEAGAVAVSPDGQRIAFTAIPPKGRSVLWVRDLDTLAARALPGTDGAALPFWSPDGRSLGFFAGGALKRMEADGGPAQTICDACARYGVGGAAWSPQGIIVFSGDQNGPLLRVAAAGGVPEPETTLAPGEIGHSWPSFLPDGRHYLLLVDSDQGSRREIHIAAVGDRERKHLTSTDSAALYAPPGYLLFVRDATLTAQPFDTGSLRLEGEPTPIAEGVGRTGGAGPARYAPFSVSANGVLAYGAVATLKNQLVWFDRTGQALGTVGPPGDYADPELSPDGKYVAVCRDDPKAGTPDIWLIELLRGTMSRLTFHPRWEVYPVWSPDGGRLAFSWDKEGQAIYLKSVGSGAEELLLKTEDPLLPLDWSADGRLLAFAALSGMTGADLWMLPLEGPRTPKPLLKTPFNETEARISPDGRFLAYSSDESGKPEVYVRPLPSMTEKYQVSTEGGTKAIWRRDGKEIFYLAEDRKLMSVQVRVDAGFETSAPRALFQMRTPLANWPGFHSAYVAAPDGQRFLAVTEPEGLSSPPITVVLDWAAELKR